MTLGVCFAVAVVDDVLPLAGLGLWSFAAATFGVGLAGALGLAVELLQRGVGGEDFAVGAGPVRVRLSMWVGRARRSCHSSPEGG